MPVCRFVEWTQALTPIQASHDEYFRPAEHRSQEPSERWGRIGVRSCNNASSPEARPSIDTFICWDAGLQDLTPNLRTPNLRNIWTQSILVSVTNNTGVLPPPTPALLPAACPPLRCRSAAPLHASRVSRTVRSPEDLHSPPGRRRPTHPAWPRSRAAS